MLPRVDRREAPSVEIARTLLDYLLSGHIQPGSRIPSERALATELGIGRSAVRDALRPLTLLGVVDVRQGDGTYLRGTESDLLPRVIEWGLLLGEKRILDLVEVRRHLEVITARLAAERATPAAIEQIDAALARMLLAVSKGEEFVEADLAFHLSIAEATGNSILAGILSSIQSLLRVWIRRVISNESDTRPSYQEHVPIAAAIRASDVETAGRAMAAHLDSATERLLNAVAANPTPLATEPGEPTGARR
jgi:GntR family transcriptional repressor for pyruvate dehydrogenase complex